MPTFPSQLCSISFLLFLNTIVKIFLNYVVLKVHCDIYKSSYNMSSLNSHHPSPIKMKSSEKFSPLSASFPFSPKVSSFHTSGNARLFIFCPWVYPPCLASHNSISSSLCYELKMFSECFSSLKKLEFHGLSTYLKFSS
jgi:hypothetical protein